MTPNDLKAIFKRDELAQRNADLQALLSTPGGRRILMHLVTVTGIYRTADGTSSDALAYAAGQRDIGLNFYSLAHRADPAAIYQAMRERDATMATRDAELRALTQNQPKD